MPNEHPAHRGIAWAEQKLAELDALITKLDAETKTVEGNARLEADKALNRLRTSRDAFKASVEKSLTEAEDKTQAGAASARQAAAAVQADLEKEWVEGETAFHAFLTAVSGDAALMRQALAARASAEREAFQSSLERIRKQSAAAIDAARESLDAALHRVSADADRVEAGLGKISSAGDESWKALREGLQETRAANDRTVRKIAAAFAKLG